MTKNCLHITNGDGLTNYLNTLNIEGEKLIWSEMLCEGATNKNIDTPEFIATRTAFFKSVYNADYIESGFIQEIKKLDKINTYSEVNLWFEYDLFCHINLIAAISLLKQKGCKIPIHLICSGRIENEKGLKGLSDLTPKQLHYHYENKTELNIDDIALAQKAWRIYCEDNHNDLIPLIVRPSNFKYLSNCLKAHLKRFADMRSGLSTLEYNILKLIEKHNIKSRHHLLGYTLHYQGYYGFGDTQIERIINKLELFYNETENTLILNRKGHLALEHQKNFFSELNTNFQYGSSNKKDFKFNKKENKLIKIT